MTLILLANGEELWWDNPFDRAAVEQSPCTCAFPQRFVSAIDADR